jgi:hypothetical protein
LKQLEKRLSDAKSSSELTPAIIKELEDAVEEAHIDLNYVAYHPRDQKYVSIFADKPNEESKTGLPSKPPIWYEIQKRTRDGTLDRRYRFDSNEKTKAKEIRESRVSPSHAQSQPKKLQKSSKAVQSRKKDRKEEVDLDGDESSSSEGGFFEE